MDPLSVNFLAVLVAAISAFIIGGLWYSKVMFAGVWMKANGFVEETLNKGNPAVIFGVAFIFTLIIAFNLAVFLNEPSTTPTWGLIAGFLAAVWAGAGLGIIALFERRPPAYFFVNIGYLVVAFSLMGLIIGSWR